MKFLTSKINGFVFSEIAEKTTHVLNSIEFNHEKNSSTFLKEIIQNEFKKLKWYTKFKVDSGLNWYVQFYTKDTAILYYFSNKARSSLDLLKIQHLYKTGKIKSAIYIVLSAEAANLVASNLTNFQTLEKELNEFKETITCPIFLIGLQ